MQLHSGFPHMQLIVFLGRKCREKLLRMDPRRAVDHGGGDRWAAFDELVGIGKSRQHRQTRHLLDEGMQDRRARRTIDAVKLGQCQVTAIGLIGPRPTGTETLLDDQ